VIIDDLRIPFLGLYLPLNSPFMIFHHLAMKKNTQKYYIINSRESLQILRKIIKENFPHISTPFSFENGSLLKH